MGPIRNQKLLTSDFQVTLNICVSIWYWVASSRCQSKYLCISSSMQPSHLIVWGLIGRPIIKSTPRRTSSTPPDQFIKATVPATLACSYTTYQVYHTACWSSLTNLCEFPCAFFGDGSRPYLVGSILSRALIFIGITDNWSPTCMGLQQHGERQQSMLIQFHSELVETAGTADAETLRVYLSIDLYAVVLDAVAAAWLASFCPCCRCTWCCSSCTRRSAIEVFSSLWLMAVTLLEPAWYVYWKIQNQMMCTWFGIAC